MPSLTSPVPPSRRKSAAALFAAFGLITLGVSGYFGYKHYQRQNPPPLPNVIAPIPEDQVEAIRSGLKVVGKTILKLTPEQEKALDEVWKTPPRSLEEVMQYQARTDQILTGTQRALFKPMRQMVQRRIVDRMLAPAADRMPPDDFSKLTQEVKTRVEKRISGQ